MIFDAIYVFERTSEPSVHHVTLEFQNHEQDSLTEEFRHIVLYHDHEPSLSLSYHMLEVSITQV